MMAEDVSNKFGRRYWDTLSKHPMNPRLVLNADVKDFYDIAIDDFTMEKYTPLKPRLKLELGI